MKAIEKIIYTLILGFLMSIVISGCAKKKPATTQPETIENAEVYEKAELLKVYTVLIEIDGYRIYRVKSGEHDVLLTGDRAGHAVTMIHDPNCPVENGGIK